MCTSLMGAQQVMKQGEECRVRCGHSGDVRSHGCGHSGDVRSHRCGHRGEYDDDTGHSGECEK